ncbi:RHS repeat-associated core domain-containing protein [Crocosphaera sp. XPORK-15E]|uniref:RHS repeat-associated core domain-containing protein n=1 Tax=Crocosphaera sp. XPORK-15E TaxID=3110247 RepID=UPI002B1F4788|nr:RHS repeat-associated core domain-containing protein [Crocosphaera sp. XPORK-15E]MEA5536936.1 RHS repeat-associated core domain-containing protein [Crocosphaera sp. XPORK-15E]
MDGVVETLYDQQINNGIGENGISIAANLDPFSTSIKLSNGMLSAGISSLDSPELSPEAIAAFSEPIIASELAIEEEWLENWETTFPQEVIDELLNPNNFSITSTPAMIPNEAPIFEGRNPAIAGSSATLIFDQDLNNPVFYWQSSDSVLGDINATIDTAAGVGTRWKYNEAQNCLFFQGTADGAIINGAIIGNQGMVRVFKDGRMNNFVFESQELSRSPQSKGGGIGGHPAGCDCVSCCGDKTDTQSTQDGTGSASQGNNSETKSSNHLLASLGGQSGNVYADRGELMQRETDLYIPGRSSAGSQLNYSFTRHYSSQIDDSESLVGNNWKHEYFQKLEFQIDGSIIYDDGLDRQDRFYLNDMGDGYESPTEIFKVLTENNDGTFDLRTPNGIVHQFDEEGKLIEISDRNDNFVTLQYNVDDQMIRFVDTLGRSIDYNYISGGLNNGKLDNITDFDGRTVDFTYDSNGNLIEVTSPTVTGTPNGNDFVNGKTTRYSYSSGFSDDRLNHNLLTVTRPNEVANGGDAVLTIEYGTQLGTVEFDKVIGQTYRGTNTSGVEAGGSYTLDYELLTVSGSSSDPNEAVIRTTETDRNGNITEYDYNQLGYALSIKEFTKGLRNGEPEFFETTFEYNADGRLISKTASEGNTTQYTYDESNPSRFANGNILSSVTTPDADRGGDQTQIQTLNIYEPIYQLFSLRVDPRGLDPNFTPPIAEPDGRTQQERYSTRYFYDYQEADASIILPLLAAELGTTEGDVQAQLTAAGIQLGLGDLNQDGSITTSIAGNLIRIEAPSPVLLAGSNQAVIEGDQLQDVVTLYRYNQFGQMTSLVDPEGNVHTYEYYAENDPDGDGNITAPPADGRTLDGTTGGYLRQTIEDDSHFANANNNNGATPTQISTEYEYDNVGNITSITDGRGIRTEFVVNELNQVVRTIRAADVPVSGGGNSDEPLDLTAFSYIEDTFYDANDNVIQRRVEDRGDTSNTGGFVDTFYTYDILDNVVQMSAEVDLNASLVTRYRYDANENLTLTLSPEGNATTSLYDERDLFFQTTYGALNATSETLSAPSGSYDVRGGLASTMTYNYDGNRNLVEVVDAEDTDQSTGNNSSIAGNGDVTTYTYDGYDRRIAVIDAVGNETQYNYDPVSNVVRVRTFGTIGGASPTNNNGTNNVLLSETTYQYDELNRLFQQDYTLFVSDGVNTVRTPELSDGSLTPNDDKVTMRYEYDRKSRQTFMIQDDEDTYETGYDGADRTIFTLDPEGNTVEFAYDDNNNLIETKETDVSQIAGIDDEVFLTTYFYDSLNRLQQSVDNIGQAMFYRYDSRSNLVAMADAQGTVTGNSINRREFANGALTVNNINDFGNVTQYFYDGISRKLREEQILTASGDGDGVNIGATIEGIKTTTPTPDSSQGGGDGIIRTGYVYDDNSLLSALVDDQGNVTIYLYDNQNRKVAETKGLTVDSTFTKANILGSREIITPTVTTINNPLVIATALINNQLTDIDTGLADIASLFPSLADQVDDTPPTTIVYGYDLDSNVVILEDENDSETFTKYDAINRGIATRIFRFGQTDSFIGDPIFAPNPVSDPSNPSSTFPAIVGTNSNNYEYDGLSRLTRATDNNDPTDTSDDSVVTFAYDSLSRVIEETQQIGNLPLQATSSGYESDTRVSVTYPNGRKLLYTYDGLDRIKTIKDDGESLNLVEYDYMGAGRVLERRSPTNGTRMTYLNDAGDTDIGYDGLRRTVTLRNLEADDTLIVGFEYGYDRMNNRTFKRLLHDLANSDLYEYDSVYRLINFERGELNAQGDAIITPSTEVSQGQDWNLDGVGNWDTSTIFDENGNPIVDDREHSSFNELTTQNGATLRYDDNGNLVEDADYTYQYDSRNRLRIATRKGDGVVAEYLYDAMGRRIRKEVSNSGANDGVTDFYYDGNRVVEERDGSNVLTQQFVYGNYIDEVVIMDRNLDGDDSAIGSGDQRYHYHQDALYSVYAVTDENGDIAESYLYDPYGEVTVFDANGNIVPPHPWGAANSLIDNPYLFTGRRFDEETGLYYYRARYLDADQGRFISRDPIGYNGGINLYQAYFVPNGVDPTGLIEPITITIIGSGIVVVGGAITAYYANGCTVGTTIVATYIEDCYVWCFRPDPCWYQFSFYKGWGKYQGTRTEVCQRNWVGRGSFYPVLGNAGQVSKNITVPCNAGCEPGDRQSVSRAGTHHEEP